VIPHSRPSLGSEEQEAVARVLASGMLAQGREVAAFEHECAQFLGRRHAVAVSSGTAALDRVAIPSYACAALLQAVRMSGGLPVLVDCGEDLQADVATAPDCRARIAVHLFGRSAPVEDAAATMEDIAQSIGGETGRNGKVAVASFYATKLLTTGEGGMLLTDDDAIAAQARDQRDYDNRDDALPRFACKMTDMQAAMGRVQLRRLPGFITRRKAIAARYDEAFGALGLSRYPGARNGGVPFRYLLQTEERDCLQAWLAARGVDARRPVYRPLHQVLGLDAASFPRSEAAHAQVLSIPLYPALTDAGVDTVIEAVRSYFTRSSG
jgi:perosamine synthetase